MKFRIEVETHGGEKYIFLYSQYVDSVFPSQWNGIQLRNIESLKELRKVVNQSIKELEKDNGH